MKKLTKIFALLLTVCLLIGAVAIVSSAATYNAAELGSGSTGIKNHVTYTFENGKNSNNYYLATDGATPLRVGSKTVNVIGDDAEELIIKATYKKGADNNTYLTFERGPEVAPSTTYTALGGVSSSSHKAPDYKYIVFDLDFTTYAYLNAD